ncbi:MAG: hypothetical protein K2H33_07665 [Muribaculaceae bacterium]|nr:hypothetical protein [Muribaculaceae bacterium]
MKKLLFAAASAAAVIELSSCGNTKLQQEEARNHELDDSLRTALANSDSLFTLLYDVTVGMDQITALEQLVEAPINQENASGRERLRQQMEAIQRGLQDRRHRIDALERQLAQSNSAAQEKLNRQIAQLRQQIDKQTATVAELRQSLEAANIHIAALDDTIDSLHSSNDSLKAGINQAEQALTDAIDELNAVYYVIGTKQELKEHDIIEGGGFLRKTKVLPSDFDRSYMQRADRRTLRSLPLDSKKGKVLTKQPEDSYKFEESENGMKTFVITNPDAFWSSSGVVVIQVD